jgi:hypothetical protein
VIKNGRETPNRKIGQRGAAHWDLEPHLSGDGRDFPATTSFWMVFQKCSGGDLQREQLVQALKKLWVDSL